MNLQDLRMLLDYHYWARDRMFEALVAHMREGMAIAPGTTFDCPTEMPTWLAS